MAKVKVAFSTLFRVSPHNKGGRGAIAVTKWEVGSQTTYALAFRG